MGKIAPVFEQTYYFFHGNKVCGGKHNFVGNNFGRLTNSVFVKPMQISHTTATKDVKYRTFTGVYRRPVTHLAFKFSSSE